MMPSPSMSNDRGQVAGNAYINTAPNSVTDLCAFGGWSAVLSGVHSRLPRRLEAIQGQVALARLPSFLQNPSNLD
jgi:hypothetical protein